MIKMKFINKLLILLIITFLLISAFYHVTAKIYPGQYKPTDQGEPVVVVNKGNKIIGAVQLVGSLVSIIALILIGIKYMVSSVEEKAANKETYIFYAIGAILIFGISNITQIIFDWATKFNV